MAAVEVGSDLFISTGGYVNLGTFAATEAIDTAAATGSVVLINSLFTTELNDAFRATGAVLISGALAVSETGEDLCLSYDPIAAHASHTARHYILIKESKKQCLIKGTSFKAVIK